METVHEGIEMAEQAIDQYQLVLDRVIPWEEFNRTLSELDKYRTEYSVETSTLVGEVKTLMLNGMDAYFSASRNVYEWAGLVTRLLSVYIMLFMQNTRENAEAQKFILLKVLDDGIEKLAASQEELHKSSYSFSEAAGKLVALHTRFGFEFQDKSEFIQTKIKHIRIGAYTGGAVFGIPGVVVAYLVTENMLIPELMRRLKSIEGFYDRIQTKVDQASRDIERTKRILNNEIHQIGDIKIKTQETKTFVHLDQVKALRDTVIKAVQGLIDKCDEYRERHMNNVQSA